MSEVGRREGRSAYRTLVSQNVPANLQTRVWQMLESVVFSEEPILRGVEHFEIRSGSGAPTASEYPSDGYGIWINDDSDEIWVVLKWDGELYILGGTTGGGGGETNTASNLGAGVGVYETKVGVDLQFNSLVSANAYLTIAEDDANDEIDFTVNLAAIEAALDHGGLLGLGDDDHTQYLLADGTRNVTGSLRFEKNAWFTADSGIILSEDESFTNPFYALYYDSIQGKVLVGDDGYPLLLIGSDQRPQYEYGITKKDLALYEDISAVAVPRSEWLQNGFPDASETTLDWDDGTLTLTLDESGGGSFDYYYDGVRYTETGSLAATITDTEGLWLFYIGSGGAASLSTIHNPSAEQVEDAILNECLVAYVYWDAANNDGRLMDERHGSGMSPETHHYLHETRHARFYSGMTPGDILVDQNGTSDTHAQFSITAGRFYDEDLQHNTLAHASTDTWEAYYVDGSGYVRWVDCEATFPVYAIGGVIAYNNAGTLTAVTVGKFLLYHVFSTNIHTDAGADYYPVVSPGIALYNTKAEAQDAALTEIQAIDFGDWPKEEVIPIATVIYQRKATATNGVEAAIISTEGGGDFIDWRYSAVTGSSTSVNDHGALSGLSDDDHTQYVLADGTRSMTGDLNFDNGEGITIDDSGGTPRFALVVAVGTDNLYFGNTTTEGFYQAASLHTFNTDIAIDSPTSAAVIMREAGSLTSYSVVADIGGSLTLQKTEPTGSAYIYASPSSGDGSDVYFDVFSNNIGGGTGLFRIESGAALPTTVHSFATDGNAYIGVGGGTTVIGNEVHITDPTDPSLYLHESGSLNTFSIITDDGDGELRIGHYEVSRAGKIHLFGSSVSGDDITVELFNGNIGGGDGYLNVYDGAASPALVHTFQTDGTAGIGGAAVAGVALQVTGECRVGDTHIVSSGVNVNQGGSGNRVAYVDLVGDDTFTDFGFRIIRNNSGSNASTELIHRGTGELSLRVNESGSILFKTANTTRASIASGGNVTLQKDLYLDNTTSPTIYLRESASATDYSSIKDQGPALYISKEAASGPSTFYLNPKPGDGSSASSIAMFRATNTTGTVELALYSGDGSANKEHTFNCTSGDVNLCRLGSGQVTIGSTGGSEQLTVVGDGSFTQQVTIGYLGGAPASPANGMIWMESDGLHIYYGGAEYTVAGV